jgi:hypothetical protein
MFKAGSFYANQTILIYVARVKPHPLPSGDNYALYWFHEDGSFEIRYYSQTLLQDWRLELVASLPEAVVDEMMFAINYSPNRRVWLSAQNVNPRVLAEVLSALPFCTAVSVRLPSA